MKTFAQFLAEVDKEKLAAHNKMLASKGFAPRTVGQQSDVDRGVYKKTPILVGHLKSSGRFVHRDEKPAPAPRAAASRRQAAAAPQKSSSHGRALVQMVIRSIISGKGRSRKV